MKNDEYPASMVQQLNFQTNKPAFNFWLRKVAAHALSFEWCIDKSMPEWEDWFNQGLSPLEAVQKLFALIRENQ